MRIDGEQQALVTSAVAQTFHHCDHLGDAESHASVLGGYGKPQNTKRSALSPAFRIEHLVAVPLDDAFSQLQPGEFAGGVLQLQLFCGKRSEEHTSELQSRLHLVCRLLLEKKKKIH